MPDPGDMKRMEMRQRRAQARREQLDFDRQCPHNPGARDLIATSISRTSSTKEVVARTHDLIAKADHKVRDDIIDSVADTEEERTAMRAMTPERLAKEVSFNAGRVSKLRSPALGIASDAERQVALGHEVAQAWAGIEDRDMYNEKVADDRLSEAYEAGASIGLTPEDLDRPDRTRAFKHALRVDPDNPTAMYNIFKPGEQDRLERSGWIDVGDIRRLRSLPNEHEFVRQQEQKRIEALPHEDVIRGLAEAGRPGFTEELAVQEAAEEAEREAQAERERNRKPVSPMVQPPKNTGPKFR